MVNLLRRGPTFNRSSHMAVHGPLGMDGGSRGELDEVGGLLISSGPCSLIALPSASTAPMKALCAFFSNR